MLKKEQTLFRVLIILCSAIILFSCSNEPPPKPPTGEEITQLFLLKNSIFKELDLAIKNDVGSLNILKIDIEKPKPESLTEKRFDFYLSKLSQIPAKRVTLYRGDVFFLVFNHGMVFAGCSTNIEHLTAGEPFKPDWANPYLQVNLSNQWFGVTKCN